MLIEDNRNGPETRVGLGSIEPQHSTDLEGVSAQACSVPVLTKSKSESGAATVTASLMQDVARTGATAMRITDWILRACFSFASEES